MKKTILFLTLFPCLLFSQKPTFKIGVGYAPLKLNVHTTQGGFAFYNEVEVPIKRYISIAPTLTFVGTHPNSLHFTHLNVNWSSGGTVSSLYSEPQDIEQQGGSLFKSGFQLTSFDLQLHFKPVQLFNRQSKHIVNLSWGGGLKKYQISNYSLITYKNQVLLNSLSNKTNMSFEANFFNLDYEYQVRPSWKVGARFANLIFDGDGVTFVSAHLGKTIQK